MTPLWQRPFRLRPNRVSYLLPGGELIDEFLGQPRGACPGASQMWVASVVQSTLPGAADSRSYVWEEDGGGCLAQLLESRPQAFLGPAAALGPTPGFLLKLLHSTQRLLVQTHPDRQKAQKYFGWPYGKTEAWYVLATDPAAGPAYVWVGFVPGVSAQRFRSLIEAQDTAAILACLHRFEVRPGDVIFIPAGLPHALGAGSLVAEIQEPSDITLRAECVRPDGSRLPAESLHSGAGMQALLDCFDFAGAAEREAVRSRYFLQPQTQRLAGGLRQVLVGPAQTDYFGLARLCCTGPCTLRNDSFRVLLVESGQGSLTANGASLPLRRGSEVFVPAGAAEYTLVPGRGGLAVLECTPPAPGAPHRAGACVCAKGKKYTHE